MGTESTMHYQYIACIGSCFLVFSLGDILQPQVQILAWFRGEVGWSRQEALMTANVELRGVHVVLFSTDRLFPRAERGADSSSSARTWKWEVETVKTCPTINR